MKLAIIGLGLMGGSFLKGSEESIFSLFIEDRDKKVLDWALQESKARRLDKENIKEIDFFLLCLRPHLVKEWVLEHYQDMKKGAIISDICGVKLWLEKELAPLLEKESLIYAPCHPMAGREVGGYRNSKKDLFLGASLIVSPNFETYVLGNNELKTYFLNLGFNAFPVSSSRAHDEKIAYTSQLAHIVSNAFVTSPMASFHQGFSADSLKDLTRVATMDTLMWQELFLLNKTYLSQEITHLIRRLEAFNEALDNEDKEGLLALLDEGVRKKALMYGKKD